MTHNSTTFTITFSKSSECQFQVTKSEIYQKKKKNVSKCSYIIKKQHITPPPSQLPFPRVLSVNSKSPSLQVSKHSYIIKKQYTTPPPSQLPFPSPKSTKKKKKNVSKRSYIINKQYTTPPPSQLPFPRVLGINSKSPSPKSTKKKKKND